jgi:uncharacterized membrane protein HdeD (DUF308 family)
MHEEMHRMNGIGMLVLGLLIVANDYFGILDWAAFIGFLLFLGGFLKLIIPHKKRRK